MLTSFIQAQNVGIGTLNPLARLHVTDSNVIFSALAVSADPVTFTVPVSGAGTRMMWLPKKSAFRAGTVVNDFGTEGDYWNSENIGNWSFAAGYNNKAFGLSSTVFGFRNEGTGDYSTAMGERTLASGSVSTALGSLTIASGGTSLATGYATTALGETSTAMGFRTNAFGFHSTTLGLYTIANSYASFVSGAYNELLPGTGGGWVNTDPLMILGNGSSTATRNNALVVYKNGNMVLKNPTVVTTAPVGFTVPISGAGTRMMWLPEKSAFRAGTVTGTQWDAIFLGNWSFATGRNTSATGEYSTAMGNANIASGSASTAMGLTTFASGSNATALGLGTTASGSNATSMGSLTEASGTNSTAMGNATNASGAISTAMGILTQASGNYSTAMGINSNSKPYASLVIGQYNDSIASSSKTSWIPTDPLFILGNGTADNARTNAVIVYKNGNTDINGYTQLGKTSEAAPSIKMKELVVNTSGTQGLSTLVAHGVTASKIISLSALVTVGNFQILPNHSQTGFQYWCNVDGANIAITTVTGNSGSILNLPVKILITYKE